MLTRTLTLAGSPNIQHTLYFDSKSNAERLPEKDEATGRLILRDEYGQVLSMHPESIVISDFVQNGAEALRAQGEIKILEVKAQGKMQKRFNDDAELKVMREEMARQAKDSPAPANS